MTNDPILRNLAQQKAQQQADRISRRLTGLAGKIARDLNGVILPGEEQPTFALFVFMSGAAQYIGNGSRDDVRRVVASVIKRWDDKDYESLHKPLHEKTPDDLAAERKTDMFIETMTTAELVATIEEYGFECTGGSLELSQHWTALKQRLGV